MLVELPYGRAPLVLELGDATVLRAPVLPPPPPIAALLDAALPSSLEGRRVTLIVSDATRAEPRAAFVRAIRSRLPSGTTLTLAIATGTHGPASAAFVAELVRLARPHAVVNHDGHRDDGLVTVGTTRRGTPVILHRCAVEADLVIATGCIRPHYFAGFGAGAKAVFPGLGQARAIRINHQLKAAPGARAGIVDGNPCREDLEEVVAMATPRVLLVNGVCGPDHAVREVVVGELREAFRRGCMRARPWFTVAASRAALVIASDALPVTASLYQAAKLAAAVAPLVADGGTLVIAAECFEGIEPLETVNEAIFRIGVLPRLAPGVSLQLMSSLSDEDVARTLLTSCSYDTIFGRPALVVPNASQLLCEVLP